MKKHFIILLFLNCSFFMAVKAQNGTTDGTTEDTRVYVTADVKPQFNGDITKWMAANIVYPPSAKSANIEGTVYVSFVIEKNGMVDNVKILRSVYPALDNEAIRVVSAMPAWQPGMKNGQAVRVQYVVPIKFVLRNTTPSH